MVLFLSLNEWNYGWVFRVPITKLLAILAGFPFIDYTGMLQTQYQSDDTIEGILDKLQGSLNVWQGSLR